MSQKATLHPYEVRHDLPKLVPLHVYGSSHLEGSSGSMVEAGYQTLSAYLHGRHILQSTMSVPGEKNSCDTSRTCQYAGRNPEMN